MIKLIFAGRTRIIMIRLVFGRHLSHSSKQSCWGEWGNYAYGAQFGTMTDEPSCVCCGDV